IDIGKIETCEARLLEDGEIGIIWQDLVNLIEKRTRDRMRSRFRKFLDKPAVAAACFKHHRRSACPTRLEIKHQTAFLCPRMFLHKCFRSEKSGLLPISKQEDYVVF